ncbi:hypothetical protein BRD01_13345 [Halobacteriales archaeon QS_8_65_32]|nr:MAG: hypothetical protein BRD01_13345 [Halobacteriales archaeon QS_8_65_32]
MEQGYSHSNSHDRASQSAQTVRTTSTDRTPLPPTELPPLTHHTPGTPRGEIAASWFELAGFLLVLAILTFAVLALMPP